jgi:hypothetical protein
VVRYQHADERLEGRSADLRARRVALALNDHRLAVGVVAAKVRPEVARAAPLCSDGTRRRRERRRSRAQTPSASERANAQASRCGRAAADPPATRTPNRPRYGWSWNLVMRSAARPASRATCAV